MAKIVETQDTLSGEPRIAETRIGVLDIAESVLDGGYTPADIADQLDIEVAAVYHALAHYHEHATEMRELRQDRSKMATPNTPHAEISKANKLIDYEPSRDIREGVGEFIEWYDRNREWYEPLVVNS